jgi:hypothetical protein
MRLPGGWLVKEILAIVTAPTRTVPHMVLRAITKSVELKNLQNSTERLD